MNIATKTSLEYAKNHLMRAFDNLTNALAAEEACEVDYDTPALADHISDWLETLEIDIMKPLDLAINPLD